MMVLSPTALQFVVVFESAAKAAAFRMTLFRITPVDVYLLWSINNLQAITRRLRANLLG
jgi:hypothetical protein